MTHIYRSIGDSIEQSLLELANTRNVYEPKTWHAQALPAGSKMIELLNHSFIAQVPEDAMDARSEILPNLPWADEHFTERVSGIPYNPPPSHKRWPFAEKNNGVHLSAERFSHTYPERFWPKLARATYRVREKEGKKPNRGIRFDYGDYNDVLELLIKDPETRQAYLPIWFPEDTGAVQGQRVPCSLGYHFIRRKDFMHCVYSIRSCDAVRHFRDDVYFAVRLMQHTLKRLNTFSGACPGMGNWTKCALGTLKMDITSFHAFETERAKLRAEAERKGQLNDSA